MEKNSVLQIRNLFSQTEIDELPKRDSLKLALTLERYQNPLLTTKWLRITDIEHIESSKNNFLRSQDNIYNGLTPYTDNIRPLADAFLAYKTNVLDTAEQQERLVFFLKVHESFRSHFIKKAMHNIIYQMKMLQFDSSEKLSFDSVYDHIADLSDLVGWSIAALSLENIQDDNGINLCTGILDLVNSGAILIDFPTAPSSNSEIVRTCFPVYKDRQLNKGMLWKRYLAGNDGITVIKW